ncbi:MAG TPA: hypothetical protein VGB52_06470 [Actinomycetota bacterium]
MYDFAIVALLGLAAWKVVGMVLGLFNLDLTSSIRAVLTLGIGVVATLLLDYSVFAAWDISIRNADTGVVITGLMVGAMAYVWHHAVGLIEAYGRRNRDEARELERHTPRAA